MAQGHQESRDIEIRELGDRRKKTAGSSISGSDAADLFIKKLGVRKPVYTFFSFFPEPLAGANFPERLTYS